MKTLQLEDTVAKALWEALYPHYSDSNGGEVSIKVPGQGDWTKAELRRFQAEVKPYKGAMAMLYLTAERKDEEVRYFEVVERAGVPERQVRSDLGAMTKISTIMFGQRKWPVRAWQASDDGIMTYVMPAEIADWWSEA